MKNIPANNLTESELQLLALLAYSESYPLENFIALVDRMTEEAKNRKQQPLF